jgi:hypothetical protein
LLPVRDLLLCAKHLLVEAIALKSHHDRARAAIQRILACLREGGGSEKTALVETAARPQSRIRRVFRPRWLHAGLDQLD